MTSVQARQLTRMLYVAVAALAAAYLLLLAGMGRGVPGPGAPAPDPVPDLRLTETQVDLPSLVRYQDVANRPLFAEDRRPQPKQVDAPEDAPPEAPPSAPLNVALTGIIHTPNVRVALLRDNSTGKPLALRERMPLPGDQGGWQVKTIEPRRVVFTEHGSEAETSVDLVIGGPSTASAPGGDARLRTGAPPGQPDQAALAAQAAQAAQVDQADQAAVAPEQDEVAQRAAEIRRRIEERRAQLRREAEQSQKQ